MKSKVISKLALGMLICLGWAPGQCAADLLVSDGSSILDFTASGSQSTFATGLSNPFGLAVDSQGNVYVADTTNIYQYTPGGSKNVFASDLGLAIGLAFDASGNLFVMTSVEGNIDKITPTGNVSTYISLGGGGNPGAWPLTPAAVWGPAWPDHISWRFLLWQLPNHQQPNSPASAWESCC